MNEKELIIAKLRKKLAELDRVCQSTASLKDEIRELIDELKDDSKLGIPMDYDYGSGELKKARKKLFKKVKTDMKALKDISSSIEEIQEESSKKIPKTDTEE